MNVETGAEAALFPEKEYINGIFVAVLVIMSLFTTSLVFPGGWKSQRFSSQIEAVVEASEDLIKQMCMYYALQQKSHLCIPFLGIARPQSQFQHSFVL
jgi:hypothetical protein